MNGFIFLRLLVPALALLAGACASNGDNTPVARPSGLSFDSGLFGDRPDIVTTTELFKLGDRQEAEFLRFFNDPGRQEVAPHERIYDYLLLTTADFDFHSATRTASQTLDDAAGNCLSLAIVTTALANAANVETGYRLVDSTPVFERHGTIVSKTIHVRSILYDPAWDPERVDVEAWKRPGIQFDYFPEDTQRARLIGNLSTEAYVAMFYSNVAGEAIARGDIDTAFWHLLEALERDKDNMIALNMLAIVYRRAGDEGMAENIYRYGIERLPENVSFLRNYYSLLKSQGRESEAESVSRSLARLDDQNPFNWVNAGRTAMAEGEYREATRHFRRALNIAPYLHEAYALLAVAHLRMGNQARGERELRNALEVAQRQTARSLYQAKLMTLDK